MIGGWVVLVILLVFVAITTPFVWWFIASLVRRARQWRLIADNCNASAGAVLAAARTGAIRRVALGTVGLVGALAVDHGIVAFGCAVIAFRGLVDHVSVSRAARVMASEPTARVVGERG